MRVSWGRWFQSHQRLEERREVVRRGDRDGDQEAGERERLHRPVEPKARRKVGLGTVDWVRLDRLSPWSGQVGRQLQPHGRQAHGRQLLASQASQGLLPLEPAARFLKSSFIYFLSPLCIDKMRF